MQQFGIRTEDMPAEMGVFLTAYPRDGWSCIPHFDAGLEILEKDHDALHVVLESFAETAGRTTSLINLNEEQARSEAGELHGVVETVEACLARHLGDEEDLAVPIILHYRLRG